MKLDAYGVWKLTFLMLVISIMLSIVVLAKKDVSSTDKDNMIMTSDVLYIVGLFVGFVIWLYTLLFTDYSKRKLHTHGLIGFILVVVSVNLLAAVTPQQAPESTVPPAPPTPSGPSRA